MKKILPITTSLILGLTTPTFANTILDNNGYQIKTTNPKSNITLSTTNENTDRKNINTIKLDSKIITKIGGFKLIGFESQGKQGIDPYESNIVTNGSKNRNLYPIVKGNIKGYGLGYGFKKITKKNSIELKSYFGEAKGKTDISLNNPGAMKQDIQKLGIELKLKNHINNLGIDVSYKQEKRNEKARFYEGLSDENINIKNYNINLSIPIIKQILNLETQFQNTKDNSNLKYEDKAPGEFLIDREIKSNENKFGAGITYYTNFNKKNYSRIIGGIITGNTRHEFTNPKQKGTYLLLEFGWSNKKNNNEKILEAKNIFRIAHQQTNSTSNTYHDTIHPTMMVPLTLQFYERKSYNDTYLELIKKDNFKAKIGLEKIIKTGATNAEIPLLEMNLNIAEGQIKYNNLYFNFEKNFKKIDIISSGKVDLNGFEKTINLGLRYKF